MHLLLYRSNVNGVRLKVVQGPRPGTRVGEGSHELVVVITHYRRRLMTCHSRYNVIGIQLYAN